MEQIYSIRQGQERSEWQASYQKLIRYKEKHGDCNVPHGWEEDKSLAGWVGTQRKAKNSNLTSERVESLDDIGFEWERRRGGTDKGN